MGNTNETTARPLHLNYLDGIRGICALYVVFFHCWQASGSYHPLWLAWASAGRSAVTVFIVLSGFVLTRPLQAGHFRGGIWDFARRRARRILPPYYGALVLSLLAWWIVAIAGGIPLFQRVYFGRSWPAWGNWIVTAHLLLIHDWQSDWLYKINGPLWSIATEWHIYFVFALLLLPLWRRTSSAVLIVAATVLGWGLSLCLAPLWDAGYWFIGCFALGMVATRAEREGWQAPWLLLATVGGLAFIVIATWAVVNRVRYQDSDWIWLPALDYLVGAAAACGLIGLSRSGRFAAIVRWPLTTSACVRLGGFSYSLYLTHLPILGLLDGWCVYTERGPFGKTAVLLVIGVPAAVLFAWLFSLVFERLLSRR